MPNYYLTRANFYIKINCISLLHIKKKTLSVYTATIIGMPKHKSSNTMLCIIVVYGITISWSCLCQLIIRNSKYETKEENNHNNRGHQSSDSATNRKRILGLCSPKISTTSSWRCLHNYYSCDHSFGVQQKQYKTLKCGRVVCCLYIKYFDVWHGTAH